MIKKYSNRVLDNIKFKQEPIALLCIANELAEANRLKRLELRHGSDGLPIACDVEGTEE
jgi:hypothetical protein|tara:strand:- start:6480 stop:6656 length:177 start_codon:yes stop_codon:yes gene_type:complete